MLAHPSPSLSSGSSLSLSFLHHRWVDALADPQAWGKSRIKGSRSSFSLKDQPDWEQMFIVRPVAHGVNSGRPVILRAADINDMHDWIDQVLITYYLVLNILLLLISYYLLVSGKLRAADTKGSSAQ